MRGNRYASCSPPSFCPRGENRAPERATEEEASRAEARHVYGDLSPPEHAHCFAALDGGPRDDERRVHEAEREEHRERQPAAADSGEDDVAVVDRERAPADAGRPEAEALAVDVVVAPEAPRERVPAADDGQQRGDRQPERDERGTEPPRVKIRRSGLLAEVEWAPAEALAAGARGTSRSACGFPARTPCAPRGSRRTAGRSRGPRSVPLSRAPVGSHPSCGSAGTASDAARRRRVCAPRVPAARESPEARREGRGDHSVARVPSPGSRRR